MKGKRILIAGCGYVGGRVAPLLDEAGARVHVLRRSPSASTPGAEVVCADLGVPKSLMELPQPLDGVVFSAGPSSPDEQAYRDIFVDGLRNLIEALTRQEQPPSRLVFTSSTAVYGQSDGSWIDESSPTRPRRFNGSVLLEAESLLRNSSVPGCALRLGGIYGPGRAGRIARIRERRARLSPGPPHYTNRIHREDAARALIHLMMLDRVDPIYLGVDGNPVSENDLLSFLAGELGLPEPRMAGSAPPRRAGSKRCRNDRLVESGYRFVFPSYREGYGALLGSEESC